MTKAATQGRPVRCAVRMTEAGAELIDERKGTWSRSEWVRQAIALAVKQGLRGPGGEDS